MTIAAVIIIYMAVLIVIGAVTSRRGAASAEDYFLAGRSFGTLVLFMALFGTNVTAFALLGMPGRSYHWGVATFGYFGATAAVWGVALFIVLGYPIWNLGKRHGFITPTQMFRARWESPTVGYLVLLLLLLYTTPYLVIGIMGAGIAISQLTDNAVSYGTAATLVTGVTVLYTSLGGMRGTAWTNVFQATVFMLFLSAACIGVAARVGGADTLHTTLATDAPHLLQNRLPLGQLAASPLAGPISVIAFPHIFVRLLTARNATALKRSIKLYPWALMMLFMPVTLLGVWGAAVFPGLEGKASDQILPMLVGNYLPEWLSAFGLAAILAAVMSSLDGQLLTVSTMLSVDVFHHADEKSGRRWGRMCIVALAVIALLAAMQRFDAIFSISIYAFSGYTLMIPVMIAAFFWKWTTAPAIIVGCLVGHVVLALCYLPASWQAAFGITIPTLPVPPVAICVAIELVLFVILSPLTRKPSIDAVRGFANPFGGNQ
ncbi:MAG: sodium:solute symporter family protein [Planctomycetota bacterium]